jgi:hypothetical protein
VGSLQERIAAYTANLLTQLNELERLREQVRKLSPRLPKPLKRPARVNRRVHAPSARWR